MYHVLGIIIKTRVRIWENKKCYGTTNQRTSFSTAFEFFQRKDFRVFLYNSKEIQETYFLFSGSRFCDQKKRTNCFPRSTITFYLTSMDLRNTNFKPISVRVFFGLFSKNLHVHYPIASMMSYLGLNRPCQSIRSVNFQCYSLILCSKVPLNVFHINSSVTIATYWVPDSPILKAFLATFGVPF